MFAFGSKGPERVHIRPPVATPYHSLHKGKKPTTLFTMTGQQWGGQRTVKPTTRPQLLTVHLTGQETEATKKIGKNIFTF